MGFHAGDGAVKPADAQHATDHADGLVVVFQHRALLDVGLEVRADGVVARLLVADVANALQLALHRLAFGVGGGIGVLQREGLGEHARSHHHRYKARAFFVGPEGDFDEGFGFDAVVVQGAHHLDARQHSVVAAERLGTCLRHIFLNRSG